MVSVTDVTMGILNSLLAPLIFVDTVSDITISLLCLLLVPLVFVNTVTNVVISVLSLWPFYGIYDQCSQFVAPLLFFNVGIPFNL